MDNRLPHQQTTVCEAAGLCFGGGGLKHGGYTGDHDFRHNAEQCHLQRFSNNTAIIGRGSEGKKQEYIGVTADFVEWCEENHLLLNTNKTKQVVIDFCRTSIFHTPSNI